MKKVLMVLALAGLSSVAVAQSSNGGFQNASGDKYQVFTNRFWDNWFISAGAGAEMLISNSDAHGSIGKRISPTLNVALGKWFTPGLGLRLQYSGLQARGYTKTLDNAYVNSTPDQWGYAKQKFDYMNLHGDVMFNLNALFGGYNPKRVYEIIPYLGAGFVHTYSGPKKEAFAVNAGIINRFRLSPALDANIELSIMGTENKFDGERGGSKDFDGVVSATAGLTYYFKARGFEKPQPGSQLISEAELRSMRDRMNQMVSENESLKRRLAAAPTATEREVVVPDLAPRSVFFNLNSAEVTPQAMVDLGDFVEQIKNWPERKNFKIIGFADSATGSATYNKELSEKRAQAVVDVLVNTYKLDRSMFVPEGRGGVDELIPPYLNRRVFIESNR